MKNQNQNLTQDQQARLIELRSRPSNSVKEDLQIDRAINDILNEVKGTSQALTAKQLRDLLFEAVTAATGGDEIRCHTIKEMKYGEVVSTSSVTGLKVVTDDRGNKHIIITTN